MTHLTGPSFSVRSTDQHPCDSSDLNSELMISHMLFATLDLKDMDEHGEKELAFVSRPEH